MRILYIDIDSLRPDHLGCYGYHRNTSPNIDAVAAEGARFENVYTTDAPCLPSRTALWSGRHGIHTGVINHGGAAAEPFIEGSGRGFTSRLGRTSWMHCLRQRGMRTATVSPFGERHSAWHWYANFTDIANTGLRGMERADEIWPEARAWLERHAREEDWFLHVNFWDPHTPYRAPAAFGEPFAEQPLPAWLTEEVRQRHWEGCGPHSAREVRGFDDSGDDPAYPRQPCRADSMAEVRRMFDGYDTGILYADGYVGRLLNLLADAGVLQDTAVIISSDHGENLGELNIYGDHQTADYITTRVPLIVRWPGVTRPGTVDRALHYHFDWAATAIELVGGTIPETWDALAFAESLRAGEESGREYLVVSQGAWSCQRAVRWGSHLCIHSYHDGYHAFPDVMLFDVEEDPHERRDLAPARPDLAAEAAEHLQEWHMRMMRTATHPVDPMGTVLAEGGPLHTRGQLPAYLARLRATGRERWAERLAAAHPREC
jgi:arylsulfatase A-like enzyme